MEHTKHLNLIPRHLVDKHITLVRNQLTGAWHAARFAQLRDSGQLDGLRGKKLVQLKRRSHVARFDVVKDGTSILTRAGFHSPNQAHTCRASLASSSARR